MKTSTDFTALQQHRGGMHDRNNLARQECFAARPPGSDQSEIGCGASTSANNFSLRAHRLGG
eukprot:1348081-Amphidinium_carterae.1